MHEKKKYSLNVPLLQNPSPSFMYAAATLFVNLTNSIDKQEMVPEMVELAKYAKQHIPEEHPKVNSNPPSAFKLVSISSNSKI